MKRALLLLLVVATFLGVLSLGASAEGSEPSSEVLSSPGELICKFFGLVAGAIWRLGDYYRSGVSLLGGFSAYMPIVLAILLLVFCFFGFRLFRVETVLIGGVAGYAVGYAVYDFLLAWQGHPAFIENWENVLRWIAVGICAILGMFIGKLLRRVGISLVLGLMVASYFSRYTLNLWLLVGVFALVCLIGIFAIKPVVIFVTSVLGGMAIANLLIGTNGFYPVDLNGMFEVSVINLVLLLGVLLGLIGCWFQAKTNRGRGNY